ncbi:MAG: DUF5412 family protein [Candidatus Thiodiazotropha sp.]
MKSWVKHTVIGSISIVLIILISRYFVLHIELSDLCGNKLIAQSESPDKKYKAVMFQRDCGATTGFSTQISILAANEELENESGNILTADGHTDENNFKMSWNNSRVLLVNNTQGATIFKKETSLKEVKILYE